MQDSDEHANDLIDTMVHLEEEIMIAQCRTKACAYLTSHDSGGALTVTSGMPLLHRLHDFDSSEKNYKISQYTTGLEPIACKPFSLKLQITL